MILNNDSQKLCKIREGFGTKLLFLGVINHSSEYFCLILFKIRNALSKQFSGDVSGFIAVGNIICSHL